MAELEVTAGAENGATEGATNGGNGEGHETNTGTQNTEKTYTEAEIQSMLDKRVNQALETAKGKWEKDYTAKLEAEKQKAAERAAMSAEERARAEFEDERKAFQSEMNAYKHERAVFEASKKLAEKGLPVEMAATVTGADQETTAKNIDALYAAFNKAVEDSVTTRLKGKPPAGTGQKPQETDAFLTGFNKK